MKIKKFIATDMTLLLSKVKEELGDEAVIISTTVLDDGRTELIAALDSNDIELDNAGQLFETTYSHNDRLLRQKLGQHHLTSQAEASVLLVCRQIAAERRQTEDEAILAESFSRLFEYGNFFDMAHPVKMFVGAYGSGKTASLVKMATLAKLRGQSVVILNTDTKRAGADAQLKAFVNVLEVGYELVRHPEQLFDKILSAQADNKMVLIDTAGINPFSEAEIEKLAQICMVVSCDKILVMDALMAAEDAVVAASVFSKLGADILLPAKMDVCRSIGAVLSVATTCNMQLEYAGIGSQIAGGIAAVNSKALARLVME